MNSRWISCALPDRRHTGPGVADQPVQVRARHGVAWHHDGGREVPETRRSSALIRSWPGAVTVDAATGAP